MVNIAPFDLLPSAPMSPNPSNLARRDSTSLVEDSKGLWFALACLAGIGLWNSCEIVVVVWWTFRHRRTLYFWSLMVVIDFSLGSTNGMFVVVLGSIGWIPMVTGQSLVLYSRLHLLWVDSRIMTSLLTMIIFNGLTMHGGALSINILARALQTESLKRAYEIMERTEVTVFFVQEITLSGLYLWRCRHFLRQYGRRMESEETAAMKSTLRSLILANLVVLCLDLSILVLEYLGYNYVQIKVKDFIYSFKLKIEIGALNSLRDFVRQFRTLDSSFQFKQQRNIQEGIQRQWESALQRAFGTVGRTRPGEPEEVHVAEGRQILVPGELSAATEGQSMEAAMGTGKERLAKDGK
ncbi:hypothetical protein KVR01_010844 [Diaporthe batatas]|uniref:uncharacterized protein n=1 Tax=Diaporthe batatas TaxID=748121 RepID=UPI001D05750B|nr:uncharacterized protein KVR01_010844 [Diaporthe batatas]KAG8159183.1 hypothetical protein KVR01_010844 [Diaporthe batatas]